MKTEVLLEQLPDQRFRATGSGRFALSVEGDSRDEALRNFERAASALIPAHAEVVTLDIAAPQGQKSGEHAWAWFADSVKNDPLYPLFLDQIERNREEDTAREAKKRSTREAAIGDNELRP